MKDDKNKLAINLGIAALSTGIAFVTTSTLGVPVMATVLQSIAGNLASSFFEKVEYNKLKTFFTENDPNDLNHDLKKVIIKSIQWAIGNIEILYKKELSIEEQKKELKVFIKKLQEEIKLLKDAFSSGDKIILASIEKPASSEETLKSFRIQTESFPIIDEHNPFPDFFNQKFIPNLQLCFGELLKKEDNRPAYIAYTRQIQTNLEDSIAALKLQNDKILQNLDHPAQDSTIESQKFWTTIQQKIEALEPGDLAGLISKSFDSYIHELNSKVDLLIDVTGTIKVNMDFIKKEVGSTRRLTENFDRKLSENWVSKHKILLIGIVLLALISYGGIYYYYQQQPFDITVAVHGPKGTNDIVLQNRGAVIINYGNKSDKITLNSQGEAIFRQIPGKYNGDSISLIVTELEGDPYKPSCNHCKYKLGPSKIFYIELETYGLDKLYGIVKDEDGKPIQGATVMVQDLKALTDGIGYFELSIPVTKQKRFQNITVIKTGYKDGSVDSVSPMQGKSNDIQLKKY